MTFLALARTAALVAVGPVAVHGVVWGMVAMMTDLGEAPVITWSAWWTFEGLRTSAILQVRVGLSAWLLGVGLRKIVEAFVFGATRASWRILLFCLGSASVLGAVLIEVVVLSSSGLGPSDTEINALLGPFAHNGLTIGAAVAVSQWIQNSLEQRFSIGRGTSVTMRQAR